MTREHADVDFSQDPTGLESRLFLVAKILLVICVGFTFASAFLLTIEFDEASIFGATSQWVAGTWQVPGLRPTLTSGGLHFGLQALTSWLVGYEHYFARIVSAGYLLILAAVLSKLFDVATECRNGTLILLAAVISVPGLLLHASLAFSALLATALLFMTLIVWLHYPIGSMQRRVFAGLLLGLTIATRFNMLAGLPVMILYSLRPGKLRLAQVKDAALISVIATLTVLSSHVLQTALLNPSYDGTELFWEMLKLTGLWDRSANVGNPLAAGAGISPYLALWVWLDRWQLATQQFPLWIMLLGSGYAFAPLEEFRSSRDTTILQVVVAFSWISWIAWLVLSPLPWYRYLLPALIGFAVVFGHLVIQLYLIATQYKREVAFLIPLLVVAMLASSAVTSVRHFRVGDSMRLVREYSGLSGLTQNYYVPFAAERQQSDLVDFIREMADAGDTIVIAGGEPEHLPMAFRSGRALVTLEDAIRMQLEADWVIVPPRMMTAQTREYLGAGARVTTRIGSYRVVRKESR